jgi:hypothetical protein
MPLKERNEGSKERYHEEWKAGNTGRLSQLRHQDVQNRQELREGRSRAGITELDIPTRYPALFVSVTLNKQMCNAEQSVIYLFTISTILYDSSGILTPDSGYGSTPKQI